MILKKIVLVLETIFFLKNQIYKFGVNPSNVLINNSLLSNFLSGNAQNFYFSDKLILDYSINLDRNNNNNPLILNSNSNFIKIWYVVRFMALFYFVFVYPFRQGFYYKTHLMKNDLLFNFDISIEIIFTFEFLLNFIISYNESNGKPEYSLKNIYYNYLKGWLIIDLITLIPFFLIENPLQNPFRIQSFQVLNIIKFLRMIKFFVIINKNSVKEHLKIAFKFNNGKFVFKKVIIKIFYSFINSFILCFIFACIWGFSTRYDQFYSNWIIRTGSLNNSPWVLFLQSLYLGYLVFITVGYGDITAYSDIEIIIISVFMFIFSMYYSLTLTSLSTIFLDSNKKSILLHCKYSMIEEIFNENNLNHLSKKTIDYFKKHDAYVDNVNYTRGDIRRILSDLNLSIKLEIVQTMYDFRVTQIGLYKEFSMEFTANIFPLLQQSYFESHSFIYHIDEVPKKIYFLISGSVSFFNEDNIVWQSLKNGSYFGDIEILRKSFRESSTKATQPTFVLTLNKKVIWNDIYNEYKNEFDLLVKNMIERYTFYCEIQLLINKIIDEGRHLFTSELAKIIKVDLKLIMDKVNSNKYFFGFGILDRLNQLRKKNSIIENKNHTKIPEYNIQAIKQVFENTNDEFNNDINSKTRQIFTANFRLKRNKSFLKKIQYEHVNQNKDLEKEITKKYKTHGFIAKNDKIIINEKSLKKNVDWDIPFGVFFKNKDKKYYNTLKELEEEFEFNIKSEKSKTFQIKKNANLKGKIKNKSKFIKTTHERHENPDKIHEITSDQKKIDTLEILLKDMNKKNDKILTYFESIIKIKNLHINKEIFDLKEETDYIHYENKRKVETVHEKLKTMNFYK